MKHVKSKITGNIGDLDFDSKTGMFAVVDYDSYTKVTHTTHYTSLEDLCEEWEDYEEPKEYWFINDLGNVEKAPSDWLCDERDSRESIGNYFETKEEAEKAVEKLKAWKRLKDKGLKFELCSGIARGEIKYYLTEESDETEKDLWTCYGGEE